MPLTGGRSAAPVAVMGTSLPPMSERPIANRHLVSPRYFQTLGIPIRAGRDFDERDSANVPHVVIVNETFARQHFPGADPIGRTLVTGMGQMPSQIVGVVADVRSARLYTPPEPDYFLPAAQRPETVHQYSRAQQCRSDGDGAAGARGTAGGRSRPAACCSRKHSRRASRKPSRTEGSRWCCSAAFAALALLLASLGVYSVMAHLVAFRTSEIGIRMALGASPGAVMRMVLGHSRRLTLVGIGLGMAGGFAVSRLMEQVLFEVDPADPLIYIAVSAMLLLVAELASWFPARRATRIDPVVALRME